MDLPAQRVSVKLACLLGIWLTLGLILEETVHLGDGAVECNNSEAVVRSVEDQVLSHNSKANEAEITTRFSVRSADIDAGQARTEVSTAQQEYGKGSTRAIEDAACPGQAAERCLRCTYTAPDILAGLIGQLWGWIWRVWFGVRSY